MPIFNQHPGSLKLDALRRAESFRERQFERTLKQIKQNIFSFGRIEIIIKKKRIIYSFWFCGGSLRSADVVFMAFDRGTIKIEPSAAVWRLYWYGEYWLPSGSRKFWKNKQINWTIRDNKTQNRSSSGPQNNFKSI